MVTKRSAGPSGGDQAGVVVGDAEGTTRIWVHICRVEPCRVEPQGFGFTQAHLMVISGQHAHQLGTRLASLEAMQNHKDLGSHMR